MQAEFEAAVERSRQLPSQSNQTLLDLYGLYKQATQGDVSGKAPGLFDVKGAAKYKAWAAQKGMSKEKAMQAYVDLVARLGAR